MRDQTPFRLLLLGDFSGRASRGEVQCGDLASRPMHAVDRDSFESLCQSLWAVVRIEVARGTPAVDLGCSGLDDLHPDRLWSTIPAFGALRALRRRLANPATFAAAALELRGREVPASPAPASGAGLLDVTLANTAAAPAPRSGSDLVDAILRELPMPASTPGKDPRSDELIGELDQTIAALMRGVLRQPAVRGFECAWRGLWFLVSRLETDPSLSVHLLDVTADELAADLDIENGRGSALRPRLAAARYSALVLADGFAATLDSVRTLTALAEIASAAGGVALCGVEPALLGAGPLPERCDPREWDATPPVSVAAAVEALRGSAAARALVVGLPRLLLRMPYGARGIEVESFRFEEIESPSDHGGYLWGSAAFALAYALARGFEISGWPLRTDASLAIEGLPADVRERDGEPTLQPAAEVLLTERSVAEFAARGATVLRSIRGRDAVEIGPLRAFDESASPLIVSPHADGP